MRMYNVGKLVNDARIKKGLTIQDLANWSGLSIITIQKIEQGSHDHVMFVELFEIAFRLRINTSELMQKFLMDRVNYLYPCE